MAQAKRDDNYVTTLLATSATDDATPIRVYVDATTRRLYVDMLGELNGPAAITTVRDTVTTAGTREQLATAACKRIVVQALHSNTDFIGVGDANVVAAEATGRGIRLGPGQTMEFFVSNTNLLYIDSVVSGEGISYFYEN